jgi:hypothetical protein
MPMWLWRFVPIWMLVWAVTVSAQEAVSAAAPPDGVVGITFNQLMYLVTNAGLGGIVLVIWLFERKRSTSMEHLIEKYDATQRAHLDAFQAINGAYRELMRDTKDTMLLTVQVQTRLVEKLERMEGGHGK